MPSRHLNRRLWTSYNWSKDGEEWSENWGLTSTLWYGTLMPRLSSSLGNVRAVELGPGHGRLTEFLRHYCSSLVLVDIAAACIEFCRQRFSSADHLEFFVNDGSSLAFLPDESVDLVFSFDSLVHADREVIDAYLPEIERVLKIGGRAFIHHSNLAALLTADPKMERHTTLHLRARDVSADAVVETANRLETLTCCLQELISWDESLSLIDCISTFARLRSKEGAAYRRILNPEFYLRARELRALSKNYEGHNQGERSETWPATTVPGS